MARAVPKVPPSAAQEVGGERFRSEGPMCSVHSSSRRR